MIGIYKMFTFDGFEFDGEYSEKTILDTLMEADISEEKLKEYGNFEKIYNFIKHKFIECLTEKGEVGYVYKNKFFRNNDLKRKLAVFNLKNTNAISDKPKVIVYGFKLGNKFIESEEALTYLDPSTTHIINVYNNFIYKNYGC